MLAAQLIPKPQGKKVVATANGNTTDIINSMLRIDKNNAVFMRRFAKAIKAPTTQQTLVNVFNFVKCNINYKVDDLGVQEIKTSPAIFWQRQCDCKGYSLFIRSILKNLGIASKFKFASYSEARDFTHVYVIVPQANGNYITLDGCMAGFNQEKPTVKALLK